MAASEKRAEPVVESDDCGGDIVAGDVFDEMEEGERGEVGDDEALANVEGDVFVLDGIDEAEGLLRCLLKFGEGASQFFELIVEIGHAFHHNVELGQGICK